MSQVEVYYVSEDKINVNNKLAILDGDEAHHLGRVRRARPGQEVWLIDGKGSAWSAEVKNIEKREIELNLIEKFENWNEPSYHLDLGLGILKGDKMMQAIDLAVQLGINELTPLKTQYTIGDLSDSKLNRAQAYALKAAKQCARGLIPEIKQTQPLEKFCIKAGEYDYKFMLVPDGQNITEMPPNVKIAVAVGCEGGFSPEEEELMKQHDFTPVSLGTRRLRSEAAVAAICSLIHSRVQL